MKSLDCLPIALLWLSACGLLAAAGNEGKQPERDARVFNLRVRAIDTRGRPIAGALIEAWQVGGEVGAQRATRLSVREGAAIRTADDGWAAVSFSLVPKAATRRSPLRYFCVTAQADGCLVTRSGPILPYQMMPAGPDFTGSPDRYEIVLPLQRLTSIKGRVVDRQGRPVADALVFHTGNATLRIEAKTDVQGRFRIEGLPEGKSPIFVTHPAHRFHGQLVDTSAVSHELTLTGRDETPTLLTTLPPTRSHADELKVARQAISPIWEAAMKSSPEGEKEWCCEQYAVIDPWQTFEYVQTHLSKQDKNRFVSWKLPLLYSVDPDEALAVLESLDTQEYMKAFALLGTIREAPGLTLEQKVDLLDRATQHLKATTDPGERVLRLGRVAVRLFELGKSDEAKAIVATIAPLAKQLPPKTNSAACAAAGEAIGLFDLAAGLNFIRGTRTYDGEYYWMPALFRTAYRSAKQRPTEAERIAAEALESACAMRVEYLRDQNKRDPTADEVSDGMSWHENRLVPLIYHLAAVEPDRAERLANGIHNPHLRAYGLGMVARGLGQTDRSRARKLILRAYEILADASRKPEPRWTRWPFDFSPPVVAGVLIATVEEIDPTLVEQCMWQAVSFRLHRPADDFLLAMEPERTDASLAGFVARYDRRLARALLPAVDVAVTPKQSQIPRVFYRRSAMLLIDSDQVFEEFRKGPSTSGDASRRLNDAFAIFRLLPVTANDRWNRFTASHFLWCPNDRCDDGSYFEW